MRQPGFVADPVQQRSAELLDDLHGRILRSDLPGWWQRTFGNAGRWNSVTGIYFWGGVGRGKTLLMDIFYQALPDSIASERIHFHSFMNRVHTSLRALGEVENPLRKVAEDLAAETQVLCLDEFVIIDIGDAMIMAGLLEALFDEGVVLVTTSNAEPESLYRDGLQRARFIPAIRLLQRYCQVVNLDGDQDYRLLFLRQTELYTVPHEAETLVAIRRYLDEHVVPTQMLQKQLVINGRSLAFQFCAEDTVWFSFGDLCRTARSQNDYLELARLFNTLILTDVAVMDAADDDIARRFVLLVDVLYDHRVKLICSAAALPHRLYRGDRLSFEFERTASRLLEMQSPDYLAQERRLP
jgi:cell division protein ZapE